MMREKRQRWSLAPEIAAYVIESGENIFVSSCLYDDIGHDTDNIADDMVRYLKEFDNINVGSHLDQAHDLFAARDWSRRFLR